MLDPIALAVPVFFVSMGVEAAVAKTRKVRVYRFADAITDLSCGIASQIEALLFGAMQLGIYALVYERFSLQSLSGVTAWVIAFFGVDLLYYVWHRLSHETNVLWAAHVVHHQSEDYNLAVALRQSITTGWSSLPFYLPLALAGVPPLVFAVTHALSTLYQFWIHTQLVKKIPPPLDWILNLPHHHRVHHAINPQYMDKNYGATLIVWDRLFGTYIEEDEECVYGITHALRSFNPMWAQVHYFIDLGRWTLTTKGLDRIRVWFASPARPPSSLTLPAAEPRTDKYDVEVAPPLRRYVRVQYVVILVVMTGLLLARTAVPRAVLLVACAAVALGLASLGGLMEKRRWAKPLEIVRVGGLMGAAIFAIVDIMTL